MGGLRDSALTARKISTATRLVVGTPAYFDKHGEPTLPGDLVAHDAVIYDQAGAATSGRFAATAPSSR